jgi:glutamate-5-semialdehyde dehydrogenase
MSRATTSAPDHAGVLALARGARQAADAIASLSTQAKDRVLRDVADAIASRAGAVLDANALDVADARTTGLADAKLRRLVLTDGALSQVCEGVRQVADLPDPVGQVTSERTVPTGLRVRRVRSPLGVIAMIYESRPAVTIDAFALCFKSGNACILRGGREAARSAGALASIARDVLRQHALPEAALTPASHLSRGEVAHLLTLEGLIDLAIPRGGPELIASVRAVARVPVVFHGSGVCHIYADKALHTSEDLAMATRVCVSAKASAPATCNAAECVLVHQDLAPTLLPMLMREFASAGVRVRADAGALPLMAGAEPATDADFGREFLALVIAVKVVASIDEAVAHIREHSSSHSEAILTRDPAAGERFTREVRSSCVLVNASTRFNDGFSLGLGAEIGIATTRVHAYGPMGLEDLTCQRWIVEGDGQVR